MRPLRDCKQVDQIFVIAEDDDATQRRNDQQCKNGTNADLNSNSPVSSEHLSNSSTTMLPRCCNSLSGTSPNSYQSKLVEKMLRSVFVITRQPDTDALMQPDYIRRNLPADNRGRRQQTQHHRETPAEHLLSIGPAVQGRRVPAFSHFTKDRFRRVAPVAAGSARVACLIA